MPLPNSVDKHSGDLDTDSKLPNKQDRASVQVFQLITFWLFIPASERFTHSGIHPGFLGRFRCDNSAERVLH